MENTFKELETEIVKIIVSVKIEYKKGDKESRDEAINIAKEDCIGISTYGYPVSVKPLSAKIK